MARMTLKQALHLDTPNLNRARVALAGLPEGGWPETVQAEREIADALPLRDQRAFSLGDFIGAAYVTNKSTLYRFVPRAEYDRREQERERERADEAWGRYKADRGL